VLSPQIAYMMTNLLSSVIKFGTGRRVRLLGFDWPAAGKTGTTDDQTDAWFTGFTPLMVAGCWVGFDLLETLGKKQTGAIVALPIWTRFMIEAHKGLAPVDFPIPPGIIHKRICKESLEIATPNCPDTFWETFIEGTEPTTTCHIHQQVLAATPISQTGGKRRGRLVSVRDLEF